MKTKNLVVTATMIFISLSHAAFSQSGWFKVGSAPNKYNTTVDSINQHDGKNVTTLRSVESNTKGFGALMQNMNPGQYLGKRVRMTGYLRSQDIKDWTGLWFRVDQAGSQQSLSFDNMHDRPIKGTAGWKKYEIVLDVPNQASNIAFGALLTGTGQIWIDNVNFEVVDNTVATTGQKDVPPQMGWFKVGSAPNKYNTAVDSINQHDGKNVTTLKSLEANIKGFGALMQNMNPGQYLGKRIRMTGYLKSQDIKDWAGLWFRVDQAGSQQSLSFDNMHNRPVKGTADWKKYEIVLDVPNQASNIAFGALLNGTGQIWIDDVSFEVVDNAVATTGQKKQN